MARAKRTERAEARRRYRAATTTDPESDDAEGMTTAPTGSPVRRANAVAGARPSASATTERVGFLDAFRQSIRPVHVRADVAALRAQLARPQATERLVPPNQEDARRSADHGGP